MATPEKPRHMGRYWCWVFWEYKVDILRYGTRRQVTGATRSSCLSPFCRMSIIRRSRTARAQRLRALTSSGSVTVGVGLFSGTRVLCCEKNAANTSAGWLVGWLTRVAAFPARLWCSIVGRWAKTDCTIGLASRVIVA